MMAPSSVGCARASLGAWLLVELLIVQTSASDGQPRLADFTCPAGDPRCTLGTSYIQRAHVVRKVATQAETVEGVESTQTQDERSNETGCCRQFRDWPNVDGGVTCGGCKALVLTEPYGGSCETYCRSFGHECVEAAEERAESCEELWRGSCSQPISGTSDMLCTCRLPSAPASCAQAATPPPLPPMGGGRIAIRGRQVLVGGQPVHLKGVCWNPVRRGRRQADFAAFVNQDAELMLRAGINAVRTYDAITDRGVLDTLQRKGIWVINSVYNSGEESPHRASARVAAVKDHPAILMWTVGNEWNYNGLYKRWNLARATDRVREVARLIKATDSTHPVASIYGEAPPRHILNNLPEIDVWGMNVYSSLTFHNTVETFARRSSKPLFMGEYGADAFNARSHSEDQAAQAHATRVLTEEIVRRSSVHGGALLGGFLFEFADEWWKDGHGSKHQHDVGGVAPGGGPYPDRTFNEEWWGIVDVDRHPRRAFDALASVSAPGAAMES